MKAGFWIAPEGADTPIAILPIGGEDTAAPRKPDFLATASAEAMIARCPGAAALLPRLTRALDHQTETAPGLLFDLGELTAEEHTLITELMGTGEVHAVVALPDGVIAQVQESVLAGLWRVRFADADGRKLADYAEVSSVPQVIRRAAAMTLADLEIEAPPEGAMNVMPVLAEIRDRVRTRRPGDAPHTISLTLLPMTPADIDFLQASLGTGPVRLVSRGYGTCRMQATAIHGVWSVQFFNTMDTMLLDTLEICDIPVVACAAAEDLRDSAARLREIEEAYFK
jgi:hydrogenase-1 operon protein HyaF